jgi:hypothetical protein
MNVDTGYFKLSRRHHAERLQEYRIPLIVTLTLTGERRFKKTKE